MELPEGLHLSVNNDGMPAVYDAQDIPWLAFEAGGEEDPSRWLANVITRTCAALGVTRASDAQGNVMDVETFVATYITDTEDFQ